MSNELEDIKKFIEELKNDPSQIISEDDQLISKIIRIEKKHLHGLEGSSERARREEIEKLIRERLEKGEK